MLQNEPAKPDTRSASLVPLADGATPRRWQTEAMLAIRTALPSHRAILISAATGTGKGTMIASMIVKAAWAGKRSLFLVHRDELIDDVMGRVRQIDGALVLGKVKGKVNEVDAQCVFASVQSLHKRRLPTLGHFDFVVTDEAHHATAKSYRAIYGRVGEVNPKWKHIGFTATPFRSAPKGKTEGLGKTFEALVYEYSLADAITDGALCPVVGIQVETELDLDGVDPDDEEKLEKLVDTPERCDVVAEKYLELAGGKQAIAFSVTVLHAFHLAEALQAAGVKADVVWADDKKRAEKIAAYKRKEIQVLCNCGLLTEGFDAPETEAVLLVRPTESRGLYAQQVGRVTRLFPGKERGLVIDFVANSDTHSLASMHDMSGGPKVKAKLKPNDVVRHRRQKAWGNGNVEEVRGWVEDECEGEALVAWETRPASWVPSEDLALIVKAAEPKVMLIAPSVLGANHFEVSLFPDRKTAWYTYETKAGKTFIARTNTTSAIVRKVEDGVWEAWERCKDANGRNGIPRLLRRGAFAECEASVCIQSDAQALDRGWQTEPATEKQLDSLRKFNLRREGLTKGEAALLLELKFFLLALKDVQ